MAKNAAMAEAAQIAEENMDLFRRALRQKAVRRQAAADARPGEVGHQPPVAGAAASAPRSDG